MTSSVQAGNVAGVVLAAGGSTRMPGPNKLLRPWCGGILVEGAISAAQDAGLHPCVVVVGASAGLLVPHLNRRALISIEHGGWRGGRASSLVAGLDHLSGFDAVQAVVVLLGDEPGVSGESIRAVIDEWRAGAADLVRVRYRDRPGHPVLLGPSAREPALALEGEESVWDRLIMAGLTGAEVPLDRPAPIDVDVPAALNEARSRQESESSHPADFGVAE